MTTDRDLIELAAQAMGRTVVEWKDADAGDINVARLDDESWFCPLHENHLTDCMGDALRLAVRLKIKVMPCDDDSCAKTGGNAWLCVDNGTDPDAATRRAITRAAAEIQRAKAEGVRHG